jgi:hypothetical protein
MSSTGRYRLCVSGDSCFSTLFRFGCKYTTSTSNRSFFSYFLPQRYEGISVTILYGLLIDTTIIIPQFSSSVRRIEINNSECRRCMYHTTSPVRLALSHVLQAGGLLLTRHSPGNYPERRLAMCVAVAEAE